MRTIVVVLGLLLFVAAPARGDWTNQRESLRGLEGIAVVAVVDDGATKAGFTEEVVKTATELRLRRNGVVVVDNAAPPAQRAVLTVRVNAQQLPSGTRHVFGLALGVVQPVQLIRDEKMMGLATTWDLSPFAAVGDRAEMREALDAGLDLLSNEWLATHPK